MVKYEDRTLKELRDLCKERGYTYSGKNKAELAAILRSRGKKASSKGGKKASSFKKKSTLRKKLDSGPDENFIKLGIFKFEDLLELSQAFFQGKSNINPAPGFTSETGLDSLEDVETRKAANKLNIINQFVLTVDSQPYQDWTMLKPYEPELGFSKDQLALVSKEPMTNFTSHWYRQQEYVNFIAKESDVEKLKNECPLGIGLVITDAEGSFRTKGDPENWWFKQNKFIRKDGTKFVPEQRRPIKPWSYYNEINQAKRYPLELKQDLYKRCVYVEARATTWGPKDKVIDWLVSIRNEF